MNARNCAAGIVVKIDFKWIILVLYGICCFVCENILVTIIDVIVKKLELLKIS